MKKWLMVGMKLKQKKSNQQLKIVKTKGEII